MPSQGDQLNEYIRTNFSPEKQKIIFEMGKGLATFYRNYKKLSAEEIKQVFDAFELFLNP